jgi:RND family efflux transporter MFP subunit
MKRLLIYSLAVLLLAACGSNTETPESKQKKIDAINAKIRNLETKKNNLVSETDTVKAEKIYPVKIQTLKIDTIAKVVDFSTNLTPYEEVYLAPATPGRIDQIFVKIGDRVRKGDLLVKMDETQLSNAKIQLAQLETEFARMKSLYETKSISAQQFEQMQTQVEVTKSSVKFMTDNTKLVAPFSGVITGKYFENGELYSGAPNTQAGKAAIVVIQQIDQLKAIVSISENYFTEIKAGTPMQITSEIYPDKVFSGKIDRIYPTIDPMTRSFKIEVKVNGEGKLRPGMFSKADLKLGEIAAIVVPDIAIIQQEGTNNRYVFINQNGIAKRINVELGERVDDQIEIISDQIHVGDQLIVAGQAVITEGAKVKVTM